MSHGFGGGAGFLSSKAGWSVVGDEEVDIDAVMEEVIEEKLWKVGE